MTSGFIYNIVQISNVNGVDEKMLKANELQELATHSIAIANLAKEIARAVSRDTAIHQAAFYAGIYHDIGKTIPSHQRFIENGKEGTFNFESSPRHNEVSVLLFEVLFDCSHKDLNRTLRKYMPAAIMWHHEKPIREKPIEDLNDVAKLLKKNKDLDATLKNVRELIKEFDRLGVEHYLTDISRADLLDLDLSKRLPKFHEYNSYELEDFKNASRTNGMKTLIRSCLVSADRIISSLSTEELDNLVSQKNYKDYIPSNEPRPRLKAGIENCLMSFNERFPDSVRNLKQSEAVSNLRDGYVFNEEKKNVDILGGAAGVGKTKVALEYLQDGKQLIWICPRVQVCESIYSELSNSEYLPDCDIEILTGSNKKHSIPGCDDEWTGDVVITTLDQVLNITTTHKRINALIHIMSCNVVVDEFHEFISIECLNLLFAELVHCLKESNTSKTLLVSATPHPLFCESILDIESSEIVKFDSFNTSTYTLKQSEFDEEDYTDQNPLYAATPPNTIVISNTAITAQRSFLRNSDQENGFLFHAKYTMEDRSKYFKEVMESFGRNGSNRFDVLRSSPVTQASLNITSKNMVTELTCAEYWLQRLGRCDRFGEFVSNVITTCFSKSTKKFLGDMKMRVNAELWLETIASMNEVTIKELYDAYYDFHKTHRDALAVELEEALITSKDLLEFRLPEPLMMQSTTKKEKLKANSLRGRSRYVQMCELHVDGTSMTLGDYVCSDEKGITLSLNQIASVYNGEVNEKKDLIAYHMKKTHQVRDNYRKPRFRSTVINNATYIDKPIFVSFSQEDMSKATMKQHAEAIMYVTHPKQNIGVAQHKKIID
ncbi:CRISPR-associated endonuclease Cas3'' [Vibrio alfacsensis]|uniref:CRISPR-associated endonuclease Cas3'' n=1 Tax=Vibrio alfacsensis TaxID=1074311 RepID=UPI002ADDA998|nr:CRISPR-associated endonuclease Cas3'' [Vibrio alfacsensis]WQE78185.1 CRISPR-associated endonuclease Cas3'' [Vibrio alfacsensis]